MPPVRLPSATAALVLALQMVWLPASAQSVITARSLSPADSTESSPSRTMGPSTLGSPQVATELPEPVTDASYYDNGAPNPAKVALGRNLFYDKVLSGNRNISCATCHHDLTATSDGLSLPVGEGGEGLGATRNAGSGSHEVHARVPRNAPHLFNKGAKEFTRMFWDGRVERRADLPQGFHSPAGANLPDGLDNPLAVQAMFPVAAGHEMAGQSGENPIADAAAAGNLAGPGGVWGHLADRLRAIPAYVTQFRQAFPGVATASDIRFVHAANALAAFQAVTYRADDSPFDRFLEGNRSALTPRERQGMRLFYGKAKCSTCHSGPFQTDHQFHSIGLPQIGPGKGDGPDGLSDHGRARVTGKTIDRYRFRTPSLRNVALTGPWGHDGAYDSLEVMVRHHLAPRRHMDGYDPRQAVLPPAPHLERDDFTAWRDTYRRNLVAASEELPAIFLSDGEVTDILTFLHALTDRKAPAIRKNIPFQVPSGLPVAE